MHDLRTLQPHKYLRALGLVLLGALCVFQVNAQSVAVPDTAFQRFMWTTTGANSQSVTVGTGGVPVASPTGSGTLAADGTKSLAYSRNATWRNGSNNPVGGSISAKIPINAKTAKLLTAGMKVIPLFSTGYALFDFARELGFNPTKDANGDIAVTVDVPYSGTSGFTGALALPVCPASGYPSGYCRTSGGALRANVSTAEKDALLASGKGWQWVNNLSTYHYLNLAAGPALTAPASTPSTLQALEDAIAAKSGWPSSSSIAQAVRDAAQATGQTIDVETPKVTGPATSPGTTTTTQNPNGTTTSTNTTHNHIYNDNRVTNSTTRTSSVVNNTTGATETTTTTEEPIEEPSECEINPNALNCAELDVPQVDIPKATKTITFAAEDLGFGGGTCPADVMSQPHGMAVPIKIIDWSSNCNYVTTYAKPMILAMALFSALMIIFVGGKPE